MASVPERPAGCRFCGRPAADGVGARTLLAPGEPPSRGGKAGSGPPQTAGDGARAGEPERRAQRRLLQTERTDRAAAAETSRGGSAQEDLQAEGRTRR